VLALEKKIVKSVQEKIFANLLQEEKFMFNGKKIKSSSTVGSY
jgi:hypothetical protein